MGASRAHVRDQVDLYLTGTLTPDEERRFEEHLLCCRFCREEADLASTVAVAVAGLPPDVVDEVGPRGHAAATNPAVETGDERGRTPSGTRSVRHRARLLGRLRPERRALPSAAAALAGVRAAALRNRHRELDASVADHAGSGSGRQFTVTVTARAGGATVCALVVGLRLGETYDLIAVGTDGRTYTAARDATAGGPQTTIVGTVPVAPEQVRFFAIVHGQGDVLLVTSGS